MYRRCDLHVRNPSGRTFPFRVPRSASPTGRSPHGEASRAGVRQRRHAIAWSSRFLAARSRSRANVRGILVPADRGAPAVPDRGIRMVVRHDEATGLHEPVGRARIRPARAMTIENCLLDVCASERAEICLRKRVIGPPDCPGLSRRAAPRRESPRVARRRSAHAFPRSANPLVDRPATAHAEDMSNQKAPSLRVGGTGRAGEGVCMGALVSSGRACARRTRGCGQASSGGAAAGAPRAGTRRESSGVGNDHHTCV